MKRKRLPIDWDDLETALTWRFDEGGHYLDLTTGEIIASTGHEDDVMSEEDVEAGLADGRLLLIEPLESSVEYDWMSKFTASVTDPTLAKLLDVALSGKGAFRRFKDVLAERSAERERWLAFHGDRVREAAREWLKANGIEPTNQPPSRGRG